MLQELFEIQQSVLQNIPSQRRYLYDKIDWKAKGICLMGGRGVGKTTLMCQYLLSQYEDLNNALYISADNIIVSYFGLFTIAKEYFKYGGKAIFIDEVHKFPNWEQEIKNIIDTYKSKQIIFSGSSSLDLKNSKYDLSRRVLYYELMGLSFREYLYFKEAIEYPVLDFKNILTNHIQLTKEFVNSGILKEFNNYLMHGYYPFFLEGTESYSLRINNIIEKVICEDIAVIFNLKQATLPILRKLIWLTATSCGLVPNMDRISKTLEVSREMVYQCFDYLDRAGILKNLYVNAKGLKLVRKPAKIFLENTNFLYSIHADLRMNIDIGPTRETFFVNQISANQKINFHNQGDFLVDDKYVIEVGGQSKDFRQIKGVENAYLAIDNIETGFGKKIPLYLFGFLY